MKKNIIFITDIGKDPDDSIAVNILCKLHKENMCNLAGIIVNCGNYKTLKKRVSLTKNFLLNQGVIAPICYGQIINNDVFHKETNCFNSKIIKQSFLPKLNCPIYENSNTFLESVFSSLEDKSVTLCICAPSTEISKFVGQFSDLFKTKIKNVVIMANMIHNEGLTTPDAKSYNISLDSMSAKFLHEYLRKSNIDTYYLPSYAIKEISADKKYIKQLSNICPNLKYIDHQQKLAFKRHYKHAINNKNPEKNKYTIAKFLNNFTDLTVVKRYKFSYIYKHITNTYLYDPYTVMLSIPELRNKYFKQSQFDNFKLCELNKTQDPKTFILDILK